MLRQGVMGQAVQTPRTVPPLWELQHFPPSEGKGGAGFVRDTLLEVSDPKGSVHKDIDWLHYTHLSPIRQQVLVGSQTTWNESNSTLFL